MSVRSFTSRNIVTESATLRCEVRGVIPLDTCRACGQKRRIQKYAPVPPLYDMSSVVREIKPANRLRVNQL